jgi:hypothetical protein
MYGEWESIRKEAIMSKCIMLREYYQYETEGKQSTSLGQDGKWNRGASQWKSDTLIQTENFLDLPLSHLKN